MEYKVLKDFKCRFQDLKIFRAEETYTSVNEKHTEKLIRLGFIESQKTKRTSTRKTSDKADDES